MLTLKRGRNNVIAAVRLSDNIQSENRNISEFSEKHKC